MKAIKHLGIYPATSDGEPASALVAILDDGTQAYWLLSGKAAMPDIRQRLYRLLFNGASLAVDAKGIDLKHEGAVVACWPLGTEHRVELAKAIAREGITASGAPTAPTINITLPAPNPTPVEVKNHVDVRTPRLKTMSTELEYSSKTGEICRVTDTPVYEGDESKAAA